ncbi:type II toxin-antitoxin system VapC family toxin [Rickettsia helvetica]|uniref:PINc domain-containing protein n=1 Tax=Rickettsia helvetica TaxID=35789 RepID=A0ABM9NAL5_RICHE|nr:type II toxin-antitoxin system VapC family toxin [Rickettsia helvetica]MCZ6884405.1 type II toxin-antitoxin system VapC family toxin [Rickettsia endosymbiont of Ixodes ricinus]MCZ6896916.1 type II toxin-antitoxin system VapC family toxin [Rickettsia endosymbiont of Ixodes ricinus]
MNLVVDCSFIMSSILPDESTQKNNKIYNQIVENIYTAYVPVIFYLECSNTLNIALKRNRINKNDYNDYIRLLNILPINVDKFCSTPESLYIITNLTTEYNLTSYDACYLELATRLEADIATLDRNLAASYSKSGIKSII